MEQDKCSCGYVFWHDHARDDRGEFVCWPCGENGQELPNDLCPRCSESLECGAEERTA